MGTVCAGCFYAVIAQLGERQTEDLKIPSSILGPGSQCTPALRKGSSSATLHYPFACATMHISTAGNSTESTPGHLRDKPMY